MAKTRFSKGFLSYQIFLKEKLKQLFCTVFYKLGQITISESEEKIFFQLKKLIFKIEEEKKLCIHKLSRNDSTFSWDF